MVSVSDTSRTPNLVQNEMLHARLLESTSQRDIQGIRIAFDIKVAVP